MIETIQLGDDVYHINPDKFKGTFIPVTVPKLDPPDTSRVGFIRTPALIQKLAERIIQLESLFTQPTPDMVQAGLAEVQRMLEEWESDHLGWCVDDVTDDQASDLAVFALQAMAGKLPKAGE